MTITSFFYFVFTDCLSVWADTKIGKEKDEAPTNNNPMGGGPVSNTARKQPAAEVQINDVVEVKEPVKKETQQEKLKQVKDLYDKGLITKEIYIERQRKIMDGS
jgi:hypothetical protein